METEEVIVKLGVNAEGVNDGLGKAGAGLQSLRHHAEELGIHAESSGRAWKKALHEITDLSPIAGVALRAALNPMVAGVIGAVLAVKSLVKVWEDFQKAREEGAKREAEHYMHQQEAASKAQEQTSKAAESFAEWQQRLHEGKPGQEEDERLRKRIEAAREESGEDKAAFLQKKQQIELEESAEAEKEMAAKEAQAAQQSQQYKETEGSRQSVESLRNRLKEIAAEEKKAAEESAKLEGTGLSGKSVGLSVLGIRSMTADADRAKERQAAADKLTEIRKHRQEIEETIRSADTGAEHDKDALKRTEAEADKARDRKLNLDKAASETKKQIAEEEAAHLKKYLEDVEKTEEETRKRAFEQEKLDRDLSFARRQRTEHENAPFMPTLKEISGSKAWNDADVLRDQFQREQDQFRLSSGMAYGQQFARDAQSLEMLEDDAKRALFIEGPQSDRFRRDKEQIKSLKDGLAQAGLQRPDDRMESIDKHIAELLDKASKDGLVVQPVNGA